MKYNLKFNFSIITIGALLEYYNFIIFGLLVGYIFQADKSSMMYGYFIFAIGYIARPLGGVISGIVSDLYGRKKAFGVLAISSAISTLAIGLMPKTIFSTETFIILIFSLRLIQSMSFGGEIPNAVSIMKENFQGVNQPSKVMSVILNATLGVMLAFILIKLMEFSLSSEEIYEYGWRMPLLFGGVASFILFLCRNKSLEDIKEPTSSQSLKNFLLAINCNKKFIILGVVFLLPAALMNIHNLFLPTYLNMFFNWDKSAAHSISFVVLTLSLLFLPISVLLIEKYSFRKVFITLSIIGLIVTCLTFYIGFKVKLLVFLLSAVYNFFICFCTVTVLSLLTAVFKRDIRNTCVGAVYNIAFVFASLAPLVVLQIEELGWGVYTFYYLIFTMVAISYFFIFKIKKYDFR